MRTTAPWWIGEPGRHRSSLHTQLPNRRGRRGPHHQPGVLKVTPNYTLENCPKPDVVVLPGGATGNALKDPRVVEWVKKVSADAEVTLSVCTGAFILAKTARYVEYRTEPAPVQKDH